MTDAIDDDPASILTIAQHATSFVLARGAITPVAGGWLTPKCSWIPHRVGEHGRDTRRTAALARGTGAHGRQVGFLQQYRAILNAGGPIARYTRVIAQFTQASVHGILSAVVVPCP
jgi:hypothetical protein